MTGTTRASLFRLLHGIGARPGRLAADIDDVGAGGGKLGGMRDRLLLGVEEAAVGERIRRDVDDAHQHRPIEREPGEGRARRRHALEQRLEIGVARLRAASAR